MKHIFAALLLLLLADYHAQSPEWAWARHSSGTSDAEANDLAVDNSGNVYVTGYFSAPTLTVSASTVTNSGASGTREYFLAKFDRAGTLLWLKRAAGSDDDAGISVAVDPIGNIYTTGYFESPTITFGTTQITNKSNSGLGDIFIVKYNPSGNVLWADGYGGAQEDTPNGMTVDASGNIYLTGNFLSLSVTFGAYGVVNGGLSDAFISKFSTNGTPQWVKRIGGGSNDNGKDVGVDAGGNVFVTGDFSSSSIASFSPALVNAGGYDIFLARYDATGNFLSASRYGAAGNELVYALASTTAGNFFIAGSFDSPTVAIGSVNLSSGSSRDMFIAKLNSSMSVGWAQRYNGNPSSRITALATDGSGNLYAAGQFNLASFSFGSGPALSNKGGTDIFVGKLNGSNGTVSWSKQTLSANEELAAGLAVGPGDLLHVAGAFTQSLSLGENYLAGSSALNLFATKLCALPPAPLSAAGATVCNGTKGVLTATVPAGYSASWFASASGGTPLQSGNTAFAPTNGGIYYVASSDTSNGCGITNPARIAVTLSVHPAINASVSVAGHTLSAMGQGAVKTWYDCIKNAAISGQTASSYVIGASGSYAVIMQSNGCADTSSCEAYSYTPGTNTVIIHTGLRDEGPETAGLLVYPNPGTGDFTVQSSQDGVFLVHNVLGALVATVELNAANGRKAELRNFGAGMYFISNISYTKSQRIIVYR